MKYLKTYEENNYKSKYWKMPTEEIELEVALDKMKKEYGCDIRKFDLYNHYRSGVEPKFQKNNLYLISREFYSTKSQQIETFWYWDSPNFFKKRKYKKYQFMSNVTITQDDIDIYKAEKEGEKYNI